MPEQTPTQPTADAFALTVKPTAALVEYLTANISADADAPHRGLPFIDVKDNVRVKPDHFERWFLAAELVDGELFTGTPGKRDVRTILKDAGLKQKVYALPAHDAHPELTGKSFGLYTGPVPAAAKTLPHRLVERKAPAAKAPAETVAAPAASAGPRKVPAGDIKVGDMVASKKKGPFRKVTEVSTGATAVRLSLEGAGNIRPRLVTPVWVESA